MTAPMSGQSPQKKAESGRWRTEQLERRPPDAATSEALCEWTRMQSSTDVNGWTQLDFGSPDDNGFDTGLPTFALSGANNLQISKGGVYSLDFSFESGVLNVNVETTLELQFKSIGSGAKAYSVEGDMTGDPIVPVIPLRVDSADSDVDFVNIPHPVCSFHFMISQVDVTDIGASVLEVQANITEDGSPVNHTTQVFHMFITRHGAVWEN